MNQPLINKIKNQEVKDLIIKILTTCATAYGYNNISLYITEQELKDEYKKKIGLNKGLVAAFVSYDGSSFIINVSLLEKDIETKKLVCEQKKQQWDSLYKRGVSAFLKDNSWVDYSEDTNEVIIT